MKSHNASYAVNLASGGDDASAASTVSSATAQQIIKKVQQVAAASGTTGGNFVLQLQEGPSKFIDIFKHSRHFHTIFLISFLFNN